MKIQERIPVSTNRQSTEVITLRAHEICQACGGQLLCGSEAAAVGSVSTDTRNDLAGSMFVGLKGENFDGGAFAGEALERGAMGVLAETAAARSLADSFASANGSAPVVIAVQDSGAALKRIASLAAARSGASVVAITGSTGKTSTKDILYSLLAPQLDVVASKASFNNEVGVPLTLLSITAETEVAVVEMGMQAVGEISDLCEIAAPEIAIITNIGPAHLEYAGTLDNIARGKAEIAAGLPRGGGLVLPYGEPLLAPYIMALDVQKVTFGFDPDADIHPVDHERLEDGRLSCVLSVLGEEVDICFNFAARHHLLNAMAAIGAYRFLGLPLDSVAGAAAQVHLPALRGELLSLPDGGTLLNDCYNANPLSMRSSLQYLMTVASGNRTVAVLGDMGELGPDSPGWHRQVGGVASSLGIDCLIAVGERAAAYGEGARQSGNTQEYHYFSDREEAMAAVPGLIRPGDVVLVKASRFMKLEELSSRLTGARLGGERDSSPEIL